MKKLIHLFIALFFFQSCESTRVSKGNKLNDKGAKVLSASKENGVRNEQKVNEAIGYFNRSIAADPNGKYAYVNRGIAYHYLKKNALAIADYNKAIDMYPSNPSGYHNRAIAKQDSGLLKEALSDYLTAKDLNRKDCSVYYNLGTLHFRMDDYPTALEYYEKATECKEDYTISYQSMGQINRMMNDYDAALKNLGKAINLDPEYTEAYEERGLVYLKQKKYDLALKDLDKAIKLSSKSYNAFFYRGLVNRGLNKKDSAQADFLRAGEIKPYEGNVPYNIGILLSENKDYAEAIVYYDQALALEKNRFTYQSRGYCNLLLKNNAEALKDFTEGIKLDSLNCSMLNSRGMVYTNLMKYDSAIVDFKRCMGIKPAFLYPYNNLANCYFKMNQPEKACEYWKLALSKGYVYNPEWKAEFDIEDPKDLVKQYCK